MEIMNPLIVGGLIFLHKITIEEAEMKEIKQVIGI